MAQAADLYADGPGSIDQMEASGGLVTESPAPRVPRRGPMPGTTGRRFREESTVEEKQAFMEKTSGYSSEDWERTIIYVYQWAPSVDLTRNGQDKKYRKIYTRHMSEEDIKRDLGSGTYELKLNQIPPSGRGEKTIDRLVISIMDYDFPPNIPPGPWLDDPKNSDWLWAKPLLEAKYNRKPLSDTSGGSPTWDQIIRFVREERRPDQQGPRAQDQLMASVITILPSLLQQSNSANDPTKVIEALSRAKDMITAPPPPAQDNTLITFVMAQLTELQKQNAELIKVMLNQKAEAVKPADPLQQVNTMAELIKLVSGIVQPSSPKEPWVEVVENLGPQVVTAAEKLATAFAVRSQMNPRPQPPRPPQPQPQQVINVQPEPIPQQQQPQQQAQPEQAQPEMDTNQLSMLMNIAAEIAQAMNLCLTGEQYADQFLFKHGQALYDTIISQPKDQVLMVLKTVPQSWQMLQPFEPVLPSFIDSFYAYAELPEEEEAKSISEEVKEPVKPKKAKKTK
jgi:hypothetical protein